MNNVFIPQNASLYGQEQAGPKHVEGFTFHNYKFYGSFALFLNAFDINFGTNEMLHFFCVVFKIIWTLYLNHVHYHSFGTCFFSVIFWSYTYMLYGIFSGKLLLKYPSLLNVFGVYDILNAHIRYLNGISS